jgi:hypothetical protein
MIISIYRRSETFDTIIAIENIAINQNIEISPNPNPNHHHHQAGLVCVLLSEAKRKHLKHKREPIKLYLDEFSSTKLKVLMSQKIFLAFE